MFHINHLTKKTRAPTKILNVIKNDDIEQNKTQIINNTSTIMQTPLNFTNYECVRNIRRTHEEGNCICFIITLIFYLINSKGKKYPISTNTTSIVSPSI